MGIVAKTDAAAKRVARSKPPRAPVGVKAVISSSEKETEEFIRKFPIELRLKVLTKAVRAASAPVRTAARSNVKRHQSATTGTRAKWSKKVRERRAVLDRNLYQSIAVKVVTYKTTVLAMTGGRHKGGRHGHLLEFGGRRSLWGKGEGNQPAYPWMRPAADTTKQEQKTALIAKVKKEWKKA